jgi:hypothetical protein
MLSDQYGQKLSTESAHARDAYDQGCDRLLTLYPDFAAAFDRATAADPGFALAHAARANAHLMLGDPAAAQAAMAAANAVAEGLTARETSHLGFFALLVGGRPDEALEAGKAHLAEWPDDRLVLNMCGSFAGILTFSGRPTRGQELRALLDGLAPRYGDDWWFNTHRAMALIEAGDRAAGRPLVERSLAQRADNAWGAHTLAHFHYEDGNPGAARAFLAEWLPGYPRASLFHGHLSWHLALVELESGNAEEAMRLYRDNVLLDAHSGPPRSKLTDGTSFLWRWELAGHHRAPAAWQAMHGFVEEAFPRPGLGFIDMHVALAEAVAGDGTAMETRMQQMHDLIRDGRYPVGPIVPALGRAFAAFQRQDYATAIEAIEPFMHERLRVGGSRAQVDIVEFTLLRAYAESGRHDDVRRLLDARNRGPAPERLAGVAMLH